ncbi:MAG: type III-B CRISPR-associated protein Cas10/Cmr2 [Synechococcales bacterium]|nr:type III-B CRISPR-associated protein Cas10/Cmr2 [Synechococcales bacterium]
MTIHHRKLYAFLQAAGQSLAEEDRQRLIDGVVCLQDHRSALEAWWQSDQVGRRLLDIASSSDRVNLQTAAAAAGTATQVCHPISGQRQQIQPLSLADLDLEKPLQEVQERVGNDVEKVFWWFWRFYPERLAQQYPTALLSPAHAILPDCPLFSYQSTVSALAGALYPDGDPGSEPADRPYLMLFTFSPVQEFIKASRKFLDFWAGSYLLHYLAARLCWRIAEQYGPDAVITPSLWGQEIMDALLVQKYPEFADDLGDRHPVTRFNNEVSTSLSTAGFPNILTALVPKRGVEALGQALTRTLREEWLAIGHRVRADIRQRVQAHLADPRNQAALLGAIAQASNAEDLEAHQRDLQQWQQGGCWEWNKLWDAQLGNTWESYWTAVPLGAPGEALEIHGETGSPATNAATKQGWIAAQTEMAQPRITLPTTAERSYPSLNVGTWWGSYQARLAQAIQAIKNTRTWAIPAAPGERSTLSGQFSAVHPRLHYKEVFREGAGVSAGSMRLFWRLMAEIKDYAGIFNGSEKLNAIELTKRLAWRHGGVGAALGIEKDERGEPDYEKFIRFPNLSSIAAARFAQDAPAQLQRYWHTLERLVRDSEVLTSDDHRAFCSRTRRPFQVRSADRALAHLPDYGNGYNGVMFSSKWLADDLGFQESDQADSKIQELRSLVSQAHKHQDVKFGESSPADWWVLVLGDGDSMGQYVSGRRLKTYKAYIDPEQLAQMAQPIPQLEQLLHHTQKRMGPATHVGLNRALLDFSNRLVPYLTEQRFCGKVIYSGGDDVMVALPLPDLPEFLRSLRAAWAGDRDPYAEPDPQVAFGAGAAGEETGYWHPHFKREESSDVGLPNRPLFTMGQGATMSLGIVIAYKSVPLPTVLETLWSAEKERAKALQGVRSVDGLPRIPSKDGLCFRVIYGSGNVLEAVMKGHLLEPWWAFLQSNGLDEDLSPLLYRLADAFPRHACLTPDRQMFARVTEVVLQRRDRPLKNEETLIQWLNQWEQWACAVQQQAGNPDPPPLGTGTTDLAALLRFTAFWIDRMAQYRRWVPPAGGQP